MWGDLEVLKLLWSGQQSITDINDQEKDGNTAVHGAANWGRPECLSFVLDKKADPNTKNRWGRTALHLSAWHGTRECCEILLKNKAQPNNRDKHGRTALFFACLAKSPRKLSCCSTRCWR